MLVAAIVLSVRGEYPRSIFDFVLGLNRWALRVVAYAAVMTPEYPPFRLDAGERDPILGTLNVSYVAASPIEPAESTTPAPPAERQTTPLGAGRVAVVVIAGITTLIAMAAIVAGTVGVVFDQTQRDSERLSDELRRGRTRPAPTRSSRAAIAAEPAATGSWRATCSARSGSRTTSVRPVFIGIAPAAAVNAYLANVARSEGARLDQRSSQFVARSGGAPSAPPERVRNLVGPRQRRGAPDPDLDAADRQLADRADERRRQSGRQRRGQRRRARSPTC